MRSVIVCCALLYVCNPLLIFSCYSLIQTNLICETIVVDGSSYFHFIKGFICALGVYDLLYCCFMSLSLSYIVNDLNILPS